MGWEREGPTEDLEVVTLETNGLVHVLKQPARSSHKDIHLTQSVLLVFKIFTPND